MIQGSDVVLCAHESDPLIDGMDGDLRGGDKHKKIIDSHHTFMCCNMPGKKQMTCKLYRRTSIMSKIDSINLTTVQ